jgi:hypothetical protein
LCLASHAAFAHGGAVTIHARTEDQIVNAVLAANASGKPTIIKVAPGQYHFDTVFNSEAGPSRLPPVTGKILILARDPSNTVFQSGEIGWGRLVTVVEGGRLIVQNIALTGGFLLCQPRGADSDPAVCAGKAGAAALRP